jgi:glycosyltransferase involved in cell wall biosynthesis
LARELARRGRRVTVLTRRVRRDWAQREHLDEVEVRRLWPSGDGAWLKYATNLPLAAILISERHAYDLLLVCGFRAFGPTAVLAARRLGKPCVLRAEVAGELSGAFAAQRPRGDSAWINRWPLRQLLAARQRFLTTADRFVAVSKAVAGEYEAAGVPASRIAHIPNGADLSKCAPVGDNERRARKRHLGLDAERLVVVYTGKLNRYKGLECLLAAWAHLPATIDAELVLVGSGAGQSLSIEHELRETAARLPSTHPVRFAGAVDDVAPWLQAADVFAFPSEAETFGISVLEAMACGLPVVASDIAGLRELVDQGTTGRRVRPGDAIAWAAALGDMLTSPGERRRLGEGAWARARRYDIDEIVGRYTELFGDLLGDGGAD